jgi:tetraacyldisaccharide 4'-kinase
MPMRWLERIWYRKGVASLLLLPLGWFYCGLMRLRQALYRAGILRAIRLPVPVIVVGNITVGGTGKTPLVIWLAGFLRQQGMRPGIVLRGYAGAARHWPQSVTPASDPALVGEEAVLLARRTDSAVVADPDRVRGAQALLHEHGCDVIVSDDGLQHLRLGRDLEIAVIDGERRFGNGFCLPAGPLREPRSRLQQVDIRVINGVAERTEDFGMRLVETGLYRLDAPAVPVPPASLAGKTVHAVAGIGHPGRFFRHLRRLGIEVIEHAFPDHHRFTPQDIRFDDALPVILTEKDAVKCERFAHDKLWYLAVAARPDPRLGGEIRRLLEEKLRG